MPRRNEPGTLEWNATVTLARNFDLVCYGAKSRKDMSRMIEDESYLMVEGPFKTLPSVLLEGLLDCLLKDVRCPTLRRSHYHLLLQPRLQGVRMSSGHGEAIAGLRFLKDRCQKLRRVDLSYLQSVGPVAFVGLIPTLTQVTVLNLSMTQIMDQVLSLIGRHCLLLQDLDVSGTSVTDSGVGLLCMDAERGVPQSPNLRRISLGQCPVSPASVAFLLQYAKELQEVDYEDMFQVFGVMKDWGLSKDNLDTCQRFELRILNSVHQHLDPFSVEAAITLCPKATNLTLSNAFVSNDILYESMRMEHLTHLRLTRSHEEGGGEGGGGMDFPEGVLPVLTAKGQQLITLLLANFTYVDVLAIGECCPRLENLALSNIDVYDDVIFPKEQYFHNIKNLEVWSSPGSESCNATILRQLMSFSPSMTNLLVKDSDALSDKVLFDVWRVNRMPHLSRLTLDSCQNVTSASLHYLLDQPNELTLLRLWGCFFISKDERNSLQRRIKEENCDLYLECCWNS